MRSREDKTYLRAYKRLDKVSSDVVLSWALQAEVAMQQALEAFGRDDDMAALEEARTGALCVLAATDILVVRGS